MGGMGGGMGGMGMGGGMFFPRVLNPYYGVNFPGWLPQPSLAFGAVNTQPFLDPMEMFQLAQDWSLRAFKSRAAASQMGSGNSALSGPGYRRVATSTQLQYMATLATREFAAQRMGSPGMGFASVLPPVDVIINRNMFSNGGMGGGGMMFAMSSAGQSAASGVVAGRRGDQQVVSPRQSMRAATKPAVTAAGTQRLMLRGGRARP